MKLTAKLILALILVVTILASLNCFLTVKREVRRFESEAHEKTRQFGEAFEPMLVVLFQDRSPLDARQLIRSTLNKQMVRWVEFNSQPNDPIYPDIPFNQLQYVSVDGKHLSQMHNYDRNGALEDYWIINVNGQRMGGLELSYPTAELDDRTRVVILEEVLQTIATLLVGGIAIALIGVTAIGRPLKRIIDKTKQIGSGDLTHPIDIQSRDELSDLGVALNDMCRQLDESQKKIRQESTARVAAVEQLRHAERLQMIGSLASGVAHELGTPLNVISGRAGLIESGKLSAEETVASATTIKTEAERITTIVRQLLDFARRKPSQKLPTDLRTVLDRTVGLLEPFARKRNITIEVERAGDPVMANADAAQIQQVLNNLLANAGQAMPNGGKIQAELARELAPQAASENGESRQYVCIRIRDEGGGISAEVLPHIFEPFYTTKAAEKGTGLGLSISLGIAEDHGGWISADSEVGKGSCFSLYLPALTDLNGNELASSD